MFGVVGFFGTSLSVRDAVLFNLSRKLICEIFGIFNLSRIGFTSENAFQGPKSCLRLLRLLIGS